MVSQEEDPEGLTAGSYTLEVTDAGGCTFFKENIPVSDLLAGREPAWMESLQIYPNPGTGLVTIRFPKPLPAPTDIQVFDLRGGLVLNLPESRDKTILLDGTGLPDGVYVIRFRQKDESALRRWVIVR